MTINECRQTVLPEHSRQQRATGNGGQCVFIVPSLDLVVVVMAGLYRSFAQSWVPIARMNRFVLAAIEPRP